MNRKIFCLLGVILACLSLKAQDKWDLRKCVTYAIQNNISVKQADIQSRISELTVKLQKAGLYPSVGFSGSVGYNFGRSVNPATNQFQNDRVLFNSYQLQSSVNLFNWFSQRHAVAASKLNKDAADVVVDKARDDIALNVAVAYLQTLLSNEQIEISKVQIQQTQSQVENIQKKVNAGSLPELNLIEVEAQLARDTAALITAQSTYQENLIQLKAMLNLEMSEPFDIEKPDVSLIPVDSLTTLQPDYVYQMAMKNRPQQKANQLLYQSAIENVKSARASMFPTLSAFAGTGSSYSPRFPDPSRTTIIPPTAYDTLPYYVETSPGTFQPVLVPNAQVKVPYATYGKQVFDITRGQRIGLNLSVPIFNNRQLRTNWERQKLDAESIQVQMNQDNIKLQSDIYSAYTSAVNAQQRYLSAVKTVESSAKVVYFSRKRYDADLLPVFELLTNENNLNRAKLEAVSARYEFVFRMKVLEFYKGEGLKL